MTCLQLLQAGNLGLHIPPYLMHQKGRYLELADSRLERRVTNEEVEKLVKVPLCCTHEDPKLRPNMVNVVGMLEGVTPLTEPRHGIIKFLEILQQEIQ
jgi:hypothetical protein